MKEDNNFKYTLADLFGIYKIESNKDRVFKTRSGHRVYLSNMKDIVIETQAGDKCISNRYRTRHFFDIEVSEVII